MSKELKMLLVSLLLVVITLTVLIFNAKFECQTVKYQDLTGTHSEQVCKEKQNGK